MERKNRLEKFEQKRDILQSYFRRLSKPTGIVCVFFSFPVLFCDYLLFACYHHVWWIKSNIRCVCSNRALCTPFGLLLLNVEPILGFTVHCFRFTFFVIVNFIYISLRYMNLANQQYLTVLWKVSKFV